MTRSCAGSSAALVRAVLRVARVRVTVHGSELAEAALSASERPVVVLSIHSGEGDSLLVLDHLLRRHRRRPRIVMHEALALDPFIDVIGRRLPNRFVDPRGGDTEVEIAAMSRDLGGGDAVLIFPEGGNFTIERRLRGIERLVQRGHHEEAGGCRRCARRRRAPGGALAALEAAPDADVVFFAHTASRTRWARRGGAAGPDSVERRAVASRRRAPRGPGRADRLAVRLVEDARRVGGEKSSRGR